MSLYLSNHCIEKTASKKNIKMDLKKGAIAKKDDELMAKHIIFPIITLIDNWDVILDIKIY